MLECLRPACSERWLEGSTDCAECGARASLLYGRQSPAERSERSSTAEGAYASSPTSSTDPQRHPSNGGGSGRQFPSRMGRYEPRISGRP